MTTTVVNKRDKVPFDTYIGRPSPWGNPFSHLPASAAEYRVDTVEEAVDAFYGYAIARLAAEPEWLEPLRGKVLACWCKPKPCHGDVIVRLLGD